MSPRRRAAFGAAALSLLAAAGAACAGSNEDPPATPPDSDGGGPDRVAPDAVFDAAVADADARAPAVDACTSAGWCSIEVDPRLSFDDLWPLEGSAVAVASRSDRSSVLLYQASSWSVLHEVPFKLTSVWASNTDVWVGGNAGYVAHGRRDGASWVWTERPLPVGAEVSTVWGTGEGEIYALADARVWRMATGGDGGGGNWTVDFGGSAADPETTLSALVGTGKNDIWITGYRGTYPNCGLVMHKTGGAWASVVESTPVPPPEPWLPPSCAPVGSAVAIDSILGKATATASGEIVVLVRAGYTLASSFARVRHSSSSGIDVVTAPRTNEQTSLWGSGADDLYTTRFSVVERGRNIWTDGGTWQISTVAFEGISLVKPLHVIRGRRSDDIWLAGESYVFHKTSP